MQSSPFRFRLPLPHNPITKELVCYQVSLPNDPRILEAFEGAIYSLGLWMYWEEDTMHTAKLAADVFKRLYQRLFPGPCNKATGSDEEECMQLRINPDDSCIIQCFDMCSQTWNDWLDVSNCAGPGIRQPPAAGTLASGETRCYDVFLDANSRWHLPVPVSENFRIVVTDTAGGVYDGFELAWRCPNGNGYLLGTCSGGTASVGTDPDPSLPHMRLILEIGSAVFDGYNTTTVVPAGTPSTDVDFLVNDSTLSDNAGSVTFRVCVTNAPSEAWSHTYDLIASNGGFTPFNPGDFDRAAYSAGQGGTCKPAHTRFIQMNGPAMPHPGHTTHILFRFTAAIPGTTTWDVEYDAFGGTSFGSSPTPANPLEMSGDATINSFWSNLDGGAGNFSGIFLYSITISGVGPDPFA